MTQPLGSPKLETSRGRGLQQADKKKGCKQKKCSNWKGGKCRCGRD